MTSCPSTRARRSLCCSTTAPRSSTGGGPRSMATRATCPATTLGCVCPSQGSPGLTRAGTGHGGDLAVGRGEQLLLGAAPGGQGLGPESHGGAGRGVRGRGGEGEAGWGAGRSGHSRVMGAGESCRLLLGGGGPAPGGLVFSRAQPRLSSSPLPTAVPQGEATVEKGLSRRQARPRTQWALGPAASVQSRPSWAQLAAPCCERGSCSVLLGLGGGLGFARCCGLGGPAVATTGEREGGGSPGPGGGAGAQAP